MSRLSTITTALALAVALAFAIGAARADAASLISGQQEVWPEKSWGEEKNEFFDPSMLGVDSSDGSVYIGDVAETFATARFQKFTASGEFKGVTAGIPSLPAGVIGAAVDPRVNQFYVLASALDESRGEWVAEKILVFSTEPVGEELVPTGVEEVSLPTTGPEAIISPREIIVDPHNDDLVITGFDEAAHPVIEMVNHETGARVARYTEMGSQILPERFGVAVDEQGIPYVVTGGAQQSDIRAYTLPADFNGTLALTPLPGFEAAVNAEGWPTLGGFRLTAEGVTGRLGLGQQVAVDSTATGDVLYFETEKSFLNPQTPGVFYVHGYSVAGEATSVIYGGGAHEPAECAVVTRSASLGVGPNESLVVLDHGEAVEEEETLPSFFPQVIRFGQQTSGLACPVPAAALELLEGATPVSSVESGTTVTMDASGSSLGGKTLTEMTWSIEDSDGTIVFSESKDASTTSIPFEFTTPGDYVVRLKMKTSAPVGLGNTVSTARTLTVTSGSTTTHTLAVNKTGTGGGSVECKIGGGAAAPCPTTVEDGHQVEVIATPNGSSELGTVSGTGSAAVCTTAPCSFTITADSSVSVELKPKVTPPTTHTLAVNKAGTGNGTVKCNGGDCATSYPNGTEVTLSATASSGSTFAGWSGAGCSGTGNCTIKITADTTVTATFNPSAGGGGGGVGNGGGGGGGAKTPPNTVKPGPVKANGSSASLTITVPGPGVLAASGKGLIATKVNAKAAGPVQLKLKLSGAAKKTLAKKGKVTVKVKIVFTPVGGSPGTSTKTITFKTKTAHGKASGSVASMLFRGLF